jgi:hypothetical protein
VIDRKGFWKIQKSKNIKILPIFSHSLTTSWWNVAHTIILRLRICMIGTLSETWKNKTSGWTLLYRVERWLLTKTGYFLHSTKR